jgi:UDP-N-acetylmuramoyl-L-alanyl-D-glutamate--2,6-diaminopimelate ligase
MTLLLDEIDVLETSGDPSDVDVLGVEHDSRRVSPGDLYCCLPGSRTDGHAHAAEAVERGAVAIVCERPVPGPLARPVVQVRVAPGGARPAMARLAAAYWGHPASSLVVVGVTGTNGKTTVSHLVGAVAARAGRPVSVMGTLSGARTTAEATELQPALAAVRDAGREGPVPVVSMEVTSHALVQSRVDGIRFDVAVFTNLSHDHLDFHGSMEQYYRAKAALFDPERSAQAVVYVGDEWGRRLVEEIRIPAVAVCDGHATSVRLEPGRSTFVWRGEEVALRLTGRVNVRNALLAAETGIALGFPPEVVAAGLASADPVPGRLEAVPVPAAGAPYAVLVDYAHTPAALDEVLAEARRLAEPDRGRVVVVFGCGGDRDTAKRPKMGAVATRSADVAIVTTDNPRREDPTRIAAEVVAGADPSAPAPIVELDRRAAIERALSGAQPGDVVVVAGKGHETYQELSDRTVPFDDRRVVEETLAALSAPASATAPAPAAGPAPTHPPAAGPAPGR